MTTEIKIIKGVFLIVLPVLLLSQTQNWIYSLDGSGVAQQVLYDAGNIYAVGSAPTRSSAGFEKTFFGPPEDEIGGVGRQISDGYIIAGTKPIDSSGVYLMKLDSMGEVIWAKFYECDTLEVIYVLGMEITMDNGYIIITNIYGGGIWLIKTNSSGDTLWTRTYSGASPGYSSKAVQQTLDKGYIIAGTTTSNNGDVYLLKTDSLGNEIWTKTYGYPSNPDDEQWGCSVRETVDNGYIIYGMRRLTNTTFGVWLLRTDSLGDTLWTRTYNVSTLPYPIGCAEQTADGGYIIAGTYESSGGKSFLLKTNTSGDSLWCKHLGINNSGQWIDVQQTLDANYIVTTTDYPYLYLSKRDTLGDEIWSSRYLTGNGSYAFGKSVYQTSDGGYIAAGTAKTAVAGDTTTDIYVIKTDSLGSTGQITEDFTIVNLNQSGNEHWIYQYDGPGHDEDNGCTITRGLDGNFYAGSFTKETDDYFHCTVVSVDSNGNERWVYTHSIRATSLPIPTYDNVSVAYGSDGNIYANVYGINDSIRIISLNSDGILNWSYGKPNTFLTSLTYGSDGNIYAAGFRVVSSQRDFLILSISSTGVERWSYEKNVGASDRAISIVYGDDDNIYACGDVGSSNALDFVVISVDTAGAERWVYSCNIGSDDVAYSLVYGVNGDIYATGAIGTPLDWPIVNLDTLGNEEWTYTYDGPSHTDDWGHSIAYGIDGNVYAAGWSESSGLPDFTVISIDTMGAENWVYRGPQGWGWSVVQGDDENIYAGGDGWHIQTGKGFTVISIAPPQNIDEKKNITIRPEIIFGEIYPNPFSKSAVISYQLSVAGQLSLKVYNSTGQLVRTLVNRKQDSGNYRVVWNGKDARGKDVPGGVYFCRLECGEIVGSKKVLFIK